MCYKTYLSLILRTYTQNIGLSKQITPNPDKREISRDSV